MADTLHGRPLQAAAVFGSRPCLLAALLTQGTARLAVSSRCMDNGVLPSQSTTWGCRTYFMSRMRGGVQFVPLLPRLLLFPIFFSIFFFFFFCFLLLYLCLLIIYTRLRESNQESLISWFFGIAGKDGPPTIRCTPPNLRWGWPRSTLGSTSVSSIAFLLGLCDH